MKAKIKALDAMEILDSRGNPTLRVFLEIEDGLRVSASVPSGASTGENEALELRDDDPERYGGKGVRRAITTVREIIAPHIIGRDANEQGEIDRILIEIDGTKDKSYLGANAILGVSMAVARGAALAAGRPLYAYLRRGKGPYRLPVPMMNVINGGTHADNSLDFQEFMLVPLGAPNFAEAVRYGAETFRALKKNLHKLKHSTNVGDEGGFAPNLGSNREACDLIIGAIEDADLVPGKQVAIALDPAASAFYSDGVYKLSKSGGGSYESEQLIGFYRDMLDNYPIVSIEDGLAENDWSGFCAMTKALGDRVQIVGDDLYVTNGIFIRRGIAEGATNAVLIKLNQIGTVTETIEAIDLCRAANWPYIVSHRSGETEDTFIADFAVAMDAPQIKTGSLSRSERVAKYNRLMEIERELGGQSEYGNTFKAAQEDLNSIR
jgi:enolase